MRIKKKASRSSAAFGIVLSRLLVVLAVVSIALNVSFVLFFLPLQATTENVSSSSSSSSSNNNNSSSSSLHNISSNAKNKEQNGATNDRQHILDIFQEAEVNLTTEMVDALPTWSQVQQVVGTHPYLLNLESCQRYRDKVPPIERMLGSAGMFNTGTNLVTHLLKQNCEIPERREKYGQKQSKESYGMRWQVPWGKLAYMIVVVLFIYLICSDHYANTMLGFIVFIRSPSGKHTPAKFRKQHAAEKATAINKEYILPVVTIRNPYSWFKSMCKTSYAAHWNHGKQTNCPYLKDPDMGNDWNPVNVRYGPDREDSHLSLGHMWNDWYRYYLDDDGNYPFVVVRMEDLVFYPKETITQVCECAGGKIRTDQTFKYIVDSAKADSPGHDKTTGIYQAWIKYSQPPLPMGGLSEQDYQSAQEALNQTLMELVGYHHPPLPPPPPPPSS
jgi:hypothetical protein